MHLRNYHQNIWASGFYGPCFLRFHPVSIPIQSPKPLKKPSFIRPRKSLVSSLSLKSDPMAATPPPPSGGNATSNVRAKRPGFMALAMKRKDSYIQLFIMTGIIMLSARSLSQKHRINDLSQDNAELRQERDALAHRMSHLKSELRREAELDRSGALTSHLTRLFGES